MGDGQHTSPNLRKPKKQTFITVLAPSKSVYCCYIHVVEDTEADGVYNSIGSSSVRLVFFTFFLLDLFFLPPIDPGKHDCNPYTS